MLRNLDEVLLSQERVLVRAGTPAAEQDSADLLRRSRPILQQLSRMLQERRSLRRWGCSMRTCCAILAGRRRGSQGCSRSTFSSISWPPWSMPACSAAGAERRVAGRRRYTSRRWRQVNIVEPRPRRRAVKGLGLLGVVAALTRLRRRPEYRRRRASGSPQRNGTWASSAWANPTVDFGVELGGGARLELSVGALPRGLRLVHADTVVEPGGAGRVRLNSTRSKPVGDALEGVGENQRSVSTFRDLAVRAHVRAFIVIAPASARFAFVQREREGGTKRVIAAVDDVDFTVVSVESPLAFIRPTWVELPV